jgi:hypothetical protein
MAKGLSLGDSLRKTVWDNALVGLTLGAILFKKLGLKGGLIGFGIGFFASLLIESVAASLKKGMSVSQALLSTMYDELLLGLGGALIGFKLGGLGGGLIGLTIGVAIAFAVSKISWLASGGNAQITNGLDAVTKSAVQSSLGANNVNSFNYEPPTPTVSILPTNDTTPKTVAEAKARIALLRNQLKANPGMSTYIIPEINRLKKAFNLPALANGSVIPPNSEFLAILGDQKSGTNIETPLSTMIEAFNVSQNSNGNASLLNDIKNLLAKGSTLVVNDKVLGRVVNTTQSASFRAAGRTLINV